MKKSTDQIIILSHMYPRVGNALSGTFVRELVRGLKNSTKYDLMVVVPIPWWPNWLPIGHWKKYIGQPKFELIDGIPHYFVRYPVFPGKGCFPLQGESIAWAVGRLLKTFLCQEQKRIIHSHSLLPDGYAGANLSRRFGYKHVCTLHGSDINIYPHRTRWAYRQAIETLQSDTSFIAVSNTIARRAQSIAPAERMTIIHNGANNDFFYPRERTTTRLELGLNIVSPYILFVGNLIPVKGVDLLLRAFNAAKRNGAELLIVGNGSERDKYMKMAHQLGIDNCVRFVGAVPHDAIPLWMSASDFLVLSSRSEGFPTVIPEAMMCGLPVIATDVGGVADAVISQKTGLLIPPEDTVALSTALSTLLNNDLLRNKLGAGAKEFSQELTWKNIASQTGKLYQKVFN